MWQFKTRHLLLPKTGATLAECEDAIGIDLNARRFAIADGATEAFDARGWAEHLALAWTRGGALPHTQKEFISWASGEGAAWASVWSGRELPWYAAEKRRAGSFAAFVGLEFVEVENTLRWRVAAVGDACLVLVRESRVMEALPVADYRNFNATPRLVPSVEVGALMRGSDVSIVEGTVESNTVLWLLSDAIAAWCLRAFAEKSPRVAEFESLLLQADDASLADFIDEERAAARLRDDDVAVLRIETTGCDLMAETRS